MKIITRQQAALSGENRFFTGKACRNGHVDQRYIANGACVQCVKILTDEYRKRMGVMIAKGRAAAEAKEVI